MSIRGLEHQRNYMCFKSRNNSTYLPWSKWDRQEKIIACTIHSSIQLFNFYNTTLVDFNNKHSKTMRNLKKRGVLGVMKTSPTRQIILQTNLKKLYELQNYSHRCYYHENNGKMRKYWIIKNVTQMEMEIPYTSTSPYNKPKTRYQFLKL